MRIPKVVLANLAEKSNSAYRYTRLYRNLYNPDFYQFAADQLDDKTPGGINGETLHLLIERLKDQTYQPVPADPDSGEAGAFEDRLVLEIVKLLLASMYKRTWNANSFGSTLGKSRNEAILDVRKKFKSTVWLVTGEFDTAVGVDRHTVISLIRKKLDDEKMIQLIWKFLKAGYAEPGRGSGKGGLFSPLLADICLSEFDQYMEAAGLLYTRYNGAFIAGTDGTKKAAEQIKEDATVFNEAVLHLPLSEHILVTPAGQTNRFLDYELSVSNGAVKLAVPLDVWKGRLQSLQMLGTSGKGLTGIAKSDLQTLSDSEILSFYNAEMKRMYRRYAAADNRRALRNFCFFLKQSMLKTFAAKYQVSVPQISQRYRKEGRFGVSGRDGQTVFFVGDTAKQR